MPSPSSSSMIHFLFVPVPEPGHINPMLCFASRLAALGCTVTFVNAEKTPLVHLQDSSAGQHSLQEVDPAPLRAEAMHLSVPSSTEVNGMHTPRPESAPFAKAAQHALQEPDCDDAILNRTNMPLPSNGTNVRFWTLRHMAGPSSLTEPSSRYEVYRNTLASLKERQGMVETLVQESKASDAPITCIICDILLCSWVINLAKRQAIPAAGLVPCSALNFYLPYLVELGKCDESEKLRQRFGLLETKGLTSSVKIMEEINSVFGKMFDCVEEASHVLLNSFQHLESALIESLKASGLNVKFIGPSLPAWEAGDVVGKVESSMAKQAGCLFTPDDACLPWLDRQEKGSVLFVSFGSGESLEEEQVQELALGIEASAHKFLWVVRSDMPSHNLPQEDFRERTSTIGMFVSWAPQRRVLQHTAVGGFLTHCGWNSTLESMMSGVPMLCFPLNGDQFVNAELIETHWKIGLPLGPPRTLVRRVEVERAVRDLMNSEDIRERIAQLKEAAHSAIYDSQISATSFVQEIANKSHKKHQDWSASLQ